MKEGNRKYGRRIVKEGAFIVVTMMLVVISAFFVTATAASQSKGSICVDEEYYQVLEENYVRRIRCRLEEQGYRNSGVALTKTVETDGQRNYEVQLHHKKLYKLTEEEQEKLFLEIAGMGFEVAGCSFCVNLLM